MRRLQSRVLFVLFLLPLGLGLGGCRCAADAGSERADATARGSSLRYDPRRLPVTLHPAGGAPRVLRLEVARSPAERARGLMYRKEIPEDGGMLFVFEREDDWPFYMRNTYIPLDLLYLDSEGTICGFVENMRPLDESPRSSGCAARFVIEVRGGAVAAWALRVGDRVSLPPL